MAALRKLGIPLEKIRLGDKVEAVTRAFGIKPCGGCKRRKEWLNGQQIKTNETDKRPT